MSKTIFEDPHYIYITSATVTELLIVNAFYLWKLGVVIFGSTDTGAEWFALFITGEIYLLF